MRRVRRAACRRVLVSCRSVAGGLGLEAFTRGAPDAAISMLNSVGALISNVSGVPIRLKALVLEHAFAPSHVLLASIGASYKEQVLAQLYKVLMSFEVLGNPRARALSDRSHRRLQPYPTGP
jgi:hypothetical protein